MRPYYKFKDTDLTSAVGEDGLNKILSEYNNKKMNNGLGKLDWINIKSAIIYGLIIGVGAMFAVAIGVGDLWKLDWHVLVNAGVFALLGSLVKNLLTTNSGNFAGIVKVIPPTE